ncbi:unnamed protein product [Didymodactylos carnosus]|uniref:Saposin B-type domain-containing protein n=1 Tax=Didymodactylos carnosus TaxID=1234261 RepID=A0A813RRR8_9BILA|nr:unnamed protein product [Didymodactylos carnosus]CAF0786534.1 unnamed protein product [Didymodactylos carnosus]CAF3563626.1 unnamed protein product [Didymodactylos carnosus]CAF3570353.1 unnamed protein product [Didymodactylos carnosus]
MYKTVILVVLVLVVGVTGASYSSNIRSQNIQRITPSLYHNNGDNDLCLTCINEAVEAINVLLNLILDEGIVSSCDDLCGALANRTSKAIGVVCDLVCDAFGIDEFIKLIIKVDIDPIWYCEIAKMCPINDQGDAKFTDFKIAPNTGKRGTTFVIDCSFTSKNGTGTSMLRIEFVDPEKQVSGNDFLIEAKKPGTYTEKIGIKSEGFAVGTYNLTAQICNGECGSQHPHSAIYDTGNSLFVVTK